MTASDLSSPLCHLISREEHLLIVTSVSFPSNNFVRALLDCFPNKRPKCDFWRYCKIIGISLWKFEKPVFIDTSKTFGTGGLHLELRANEKLVSAVRISFLVNGPIHTQSQKLEFQGDVSILGSNWFFFPPCLKMIECETFYTREITWQVFLMLFLWGKVKSAVQAFKCYSTLWGRTFVSINYYQG